MAQDIDLNALMSSLSFWEKAGYVGLAAVLIGVVGETIHEFASRPRWSWWGPKGGRLSALILIAGLAIEGVAQINANSISGRVIAFLGNEEASTRERAANLEKETEAARGQIADATKAAAAANERAANLEKEAAAANERAAEIMKATAWRQFQPDQVAELRQTLSAHPGKVIVAWIANDSESFALALQFLKILTDAKWEARTSARTYAGALLFGIWVPDTEGAKADTAVLRDALTKVGHAPATGKLPAESMSFTQAAGVDFATVLFGSKKPTFAQPP